jgi:alpha-ketoglutaric semialdehyde dehydrogenase
MTQLHGNNFLAGGLQGAAETFTAVSPLDGSDLPGRFAMASTAEVDTAMEAAAAASGPLAATSGEERAVFLERIAEEIEALGDALLERAHLETALPLARLAGERGRTVGQLRLFASMARDGSWTDPRIDRALPDRQPLPRPDLRRAKRPIGPVVVFGSSNFPLAFSVAGGDTASALCTGNPVVVKAHRAHPGTSELVATAIAKAVEACDMPAGAFSMLHGQGSVIGLALVRHPATQAVGFTGSRAAGRALCDAAAGRPDPIPVFAEMSSMNPVFLLPAAVAERAEAIAQGFVASMTLGVGQFCTKPGLVFAVEGPELDAFRQAVAAAVTAVPAASMLTADIRDSFAAGRDTLVGLDGTTTLATAEATADDTKTQATAVVVQTDLATFLADPRYAEEVFGPASLLVTAGSVDELGKAAAALEGQLTATLHGTESDLEGASGLVEILSTRAGRLIVNGFPTGVEVCQAMQHGGPWPATSDSRFTSVGAAALERFIRPVCYQDVPDALLPDPLKDANPLGLERLVNGVRGQH